MCDLQRDVTQRHQCNQESDGLRITLHLERAGQRVLSLHHERDGQRALTLHQERNGQRALTLHQEHNSKRALTLHQERDGQRSLSVLVGGGAVEDARVGRSGVSDAEYGGAASITTAVSCAVPRHVGGVSAIGYEMIPPFSRFMCRI